MYWNVSSLKLREKIIEILKSYAHHVAYMYVYNAYRTKIKRENNRNFELLCTSYCIHVCL